MNCIHIFKRLLIRNSILRAPANLETQVLVLGKDDLRTIYFDKGNLSHVGTYFTCFLYCITWKVQYLSNVQTLKGLNKLFLYVHNGAGSEHEVHLGRHLTLSPTVFV